MANWSVPSLSDLYSNFLSYLKARDDDAVRMNDSRVTAATNLPDYSKRWNATALRFENWLSSAWSALVLSVAGGGTGASTREDARTNLDVYSKAEADAAFITSLTTAENVLSGDVALTTAPTYYDGPLVSLAAGTWLVIGTVTLASDPIAGVSPVYTVKLWDGTTAYAFVDIKLPINSGGYSSTVVPITDIITLGATTTVRVAVAKGSAVTAKIAGTYSHIRAVKIA